MNMPLRLLMLTLVSSVIACSGAEPEALDLPVNVADPLEPGQAGTLLELADPGRSISEVALSSNYLYFAVDWAGVYRMPKYGGDVVPLQQDRNAIFRHVSTHGDRVFWDYITFPNDTPETSLYTRVNSQPVEGGPTTTIAEGYFGISLGFADSGGYLVWSSYPAGASAASLERLPVAGGARETLVDFVSYMDVPYWRADDEGVYFTTHPAGGNPVGDCAVEWLLPGSAPETLAPCPTPDSDVVGLGPDVVYVHSPHALWQVSRRDRSVSAIQAFPADTYVSAATFDDANVYAIVYSDATSWSWTRFPKAGGTPTAFADASLCPNLGGSWALATDIEYVYLVCGFNRVVVVPKSAAP